jgi:hypothetical protein
VTNARPNFSPFPWDRVPRVRRADAAFASAVARWCAARPGGGKLAALVGGPVTARLIGVVAGAADPHAAIAVVVRGGLRVAVAGAARPVRALAQRLLGGPAELDAPRPLTVVEQAIWALAVAAGVADLGIDGEVWPLAGAPAPGAIAVEVALGLPPGLGAATMTVVAHLPPELALRAPPPRPPPRWAFALPVVVGRCALARAAVRGLTLGDVVTVERCLELVIGAGAIGLRASPGAVEARVATEYVARDVAILDDAQLEVTVQLGAVRMSLRALGELAVGQVVALGRPLAGPYEIRAAGQLVGHGELVDLDGELGVRIVSTSESPADLPDQE